MQELYIVSVYNPDETDAPDCSLFSRLDLAESYVAELEKLTCYTIIHPVIVDADCDFKALTVYRYKISYTSEGVKERQWSYHTYPTDKRDKLPVAVSYRRLVPHSSDPTLVPDYVMGQSYVSYDDAKAIAETTVKQLRSQLESGMTAQQITDYWREYNKSINNLVRLQK